MKLVTAAKTNTYELTYLVAGALTDSELTKLQEIVRNLVKEHTGSLVSEAVWGKKLLSYPIKKAGKTYTEAHYVHLVLEFPTDKAVAFERGIYLDNEIMRHLFVVAEKVSKKAEKKTKEIVKEVVKEKAVEAK